MIYHIQTTSTETGTNAKYQMQRKHSQKSYGEFLTVLLMVFYQRSTHTICTKADPVHYNLIWPLY